MAHQDCCELTLGLRASSSQTGSGKQEGWGREDGTKYPGSSQGRGQCHLHRRYHFLGSPAFCLMWQDHQVQTLLRPKPLPELSSGQP